MNTRMLSSALVGGVDGVRLREHMLASGAGEQVDPALRLERYDFADVRRVRWWAYVAFVLRSLAAGEESSEADPVDRTLHRLVVLSGWRFGLLDPQTVSPPREVPAGLVSWVSANRLAVADALLPEGFCQLDGAIESGGWPSVEDWLDDILVPAVGNRYGMELVSFGGQRSVYWQSADGNAGWSLLPAGCQEEVPGWSGVAGWDLELVWSLVHGMVSKVPGSAMGRVLESTWADPGGVPCLVHLFDWLAGRRLLVRVRDRPALAQVARWVREQASVRPPEGRQELRQEPAPAQVDRLAPVERPAEQRLTSEQRPVVRRGWFAGLVSVASPTPAAAPAPTPTAPPAAAPTGRYGTVIGLPARGSKRGPPEPEDGGRLAPARAGSDFRRAIQTVYKGEKFRSRLEARVAEFLDGLGVAWMYEPDRVDLLAVGRIHGSCQARHMSLAGPGSEEAGEERPSLILGAPDQARRDTRHYFPDFYLPDVGPRGTYVEVKPALPSLYEMQRCEWLSRRPGVQVLVMSAIDGVLELPWVDYSRRYERSDGRTVGARSEENVLRMMLFRGGRAVGGPLGAVWVDLGSTADLVCPSTVEELLGLAWRTPRLLAAYRTARELRFDAPEAPGASGPDSGAAGRAVLDLDRECAF